MDTLASPPPARQAVAPSLIFILIDGLAAYATQHMAWLHAMTMAGRARHACIECALPPLSRPLYHTIFTGQNPTQSGIVHNMCWHMPPNAPSSIFTRATAQGLTTAAAAWYWVSELCNTIPFEQHHRLTHAPHAPIQHGLFYTNAHYPDDHVFLDAEALRHAYNPHLLLVHSMGVDTAGHKAGGESKAYRNAVREVDMLLARYVPHWLACGYGIIITSDHGMHPDGHHNDMCAAVRKVPLWVMDIEGALPTAQEQWCDFVCAALWG